MNKKIQLLSNFLMFPFLFSNFNSLAMESNNSLFLESFLNECFNDYFNKNEMLECMFNHETLNALIHFKQFVTLTDCKNLVRNMFNIIDLMQENGLEYNFYNMKKMLVSDLCKMFYSFFLDGQCICDFNLIEKKTEYILYKFDESSKFLRDLMKCLREYNMRCNNSNFESLETLFGDVVKNKKFCNYCENIIKIMLEIIDYINNSLDISNSRLSCEVFYYKNINEKGSENIYDIVIKFTAN